MKKVIRYFIFFFFIFKSISALAARSAEVIVDDAPVHEYPQAKSGIVGNLKKDAVIAVSNKPIEGFYKTRLSDGTLGWISGNDIYVKNGAKAGKPVQEDTFEKPESNEEKTSKKSGTEEWTSRKRLILMYGIQNLNYGQLLTLFSASSSDLNPGAGFTFEYQFPLSEDFRWAIRVETFSATAPARTLSSGNVQSLQMRSMPILLGANYSPIAGKRIRLGVGAYLGVAASPLSTTWNSTTVQRTGGNNPGNVVYTSSDFCADLSLQGDVGLTKHLAFVYDFTYHYQPSSGQQSTQYFSATGSSTPSFTIDYSGIVYRGGLEIRF